MSPSCSYYKKLILVLIFITSYSSLYSQWYWQNPLPQGNTLRSVHISKSGFSTVVGDFGTIITSNNNFNTWKLIDCGIDAFLYCVSFPNNFVGYVVGSKGTILKTVNSGMNWSKLISISTDELMCLYFINSEVGYIGSYNGKILKTSDGGLTWSQQHTNVENSLYSLYFITENKGFAVGTNGLILFTEDGGLNWIKRDSITSKTLRKIQFLDENNGFILAERQFFKTNDGGNSWLKYELPADLFFDMFFLNKQQGIVIGSSIYRTTNCGTSWIKDSEYQSKNFRSINFADSSQGIIVGENGLILMTTNGGIKWLTKSKNVITDKPVHLYFSENNNGIILTYLSGDIYKTTNSDGLWSKIGIVPSGFIYGGNFLSETFGLAVGPSGRIYKTTDYGVTWSNYSISELYTHLYSAWILNEDTVVTVGFEAVSGNPGAILRSSNGGKNWQKINTGIMGSSFKDICFSDDNIGLCVGTNGVILRTSNSGLDWTQIINVPNNNFNKVLFADLKTAFVLGNNGMILKTTDTGHSWQSINSNTSINLNGIHFKGSSLGLIGGLYGVLLKTQDEGETWEQLQTKFYNDISFVNVHDDKNFFIVSSSGQIMNTKKGGVMSIENRFVANYPSEFVLYQNYPNPFNSSTKITFQIPTVCHVFLKVYDILGREIAILVDEVKEPGIHTHTFSNLNYQLASGVYFYELTANKFSEHFKHTFVRTQKCIIMK